jgi:hypothetical protein
MRLATISLQALDRLYKAVDDEATALDGFGNATPL